MEDTFFFNLIAYFFTSTLPSTMTALLKNLLWRSMSMIHLFALIRLITRNESLVEEEEENDENSRTEQCARCGDNGGEVAYDDMTMVMRRLGVLGWSEKLEVCGGGNKCNECSLAEEALALMEKKEASLEELEEAFYVFDRNADGLISPAELWSVMRRLGMEEGMRYEDCERMVGAFDEDGDGRISFPEFKSMMENAI